jgi:glycosyltransferase involved in cell wall biosynthesis
VDLISLPLEWMFPPENRKPSSFLMLFHSQWWKGSADGLQALERIRVDHPGTIMHLFGTSPRPADLPEAFIYHQEPPQPELRALYNQAAIFVAPSVTEGWGLPATEAMVCGAALAATDNGGHREFAIPEETALLSPPNDPEKLAQNLSRLVTDHDLRHRLAKSGHAFVQQFTWKRAFDRFELLLGVRTNGGF